jgi:phosphatidylserine synthase
MSAPLEAPYRDVHISNALTYASLACGLIALAAGAVPHGVHVAGASLALAALADTFDGRFARLFRRSDRQKDAGGQLDSLVDACVFGVVPIAVLARYAAPDPGGGTLVWWSAAFGYCLAVVTRLGSFNVSGDDRLFVGIPTPAVALIWSTMLLAQPSATFVAAAFLAAAAAMVAPIAIARPRRAVLALFAAWAVALVLTHVVSGSTGTR